ncbi:MAG: PKD domain-containing protein [Krumholzibacteria bacterium]|nr:PKD domain-containing protein [Candidatus Krumholzibacteria bacterium]
MRKRRCLACLSWALAVVAGWAIATEPAPAAAQCANYENYMHWIQDIDARGASVRGIEVAGTTAYTVAAFDNYSGLLTAYDISNPGKASRLGDLALTGSYWFGRGDVEGSYLFVVSDNPRQMHTIDVSDPAHPAEIAAVNLVFAPLDIAVSGSLALIVTSMGQLHVFDVSNPSAPVSVSIVNVPSSGRKVEIAGDYAYVYCEDGGLRIYNIADPANLLAAGSVSLFDGHPAHESSRDFALAGDRIYAPVMESGKVHMVDVLDPANPQLIASLDLANGGFIDVSGDLAYVSDPTGMSVIDVSSPTALEFLGWVPYASSGSGWPAVDVVAAGSFLYLAFGRTGDNTLDSEVFSLGSPCDRGVVGSLDTPGSAEAVVIDGNYAYVADGPGGVRIIDVTDPLVPVEVGSYDTPGYATKLVVSGGFAFVADGEQGLQILDVVDPLNPVFKGATGTAHDAVALDIADSLVYIADSDSGLTVVNAADLAAPVVIARVDTGGSTRDVAVAGEYAFLADGSGGLRTVNRNVEEPSDPWIIGGVKSFSVNDARGVMVDGTLAYVADADSGLYIIDVFDPATPIPLGEAATQSAASDVFVSDSFAYVADGGSGLKLFNVQTPAEPYIAANLAVPSVTRGVFVTQYYTFIAAADSGLQIVPSQCAFAEYPTAFFNMSSATAFRPAAIAFFDNSTGYITGYDWDFGDGTAHSTAVSPVHLYDVPGDYLVTLTVSSPTTSDSMTRSLTILTEAPYITAVTDVPADQGGFVYLEFHKSFYDDTLPSDAGPDKAAEIYTIQRQDDGRWVTVATSGAYGDQYYSVLAGTQGDGAVDWTTVFRVIAHMDEGIWIGPEASGFSEDNIAPAAPTDLAWQEDGMLTWSPVAAYDLAYYKVCTGPNGSFAESTPFGTTVETRMDLSSSTDSWVFVVAVDDADLESLPSTPVAVSGVPDAGNALRLFPAVPNPFNPSTTIRFVLPEECRARLAIYDVSGRLVRVLVDRYMAPGIHGAVWLGEDQAGRAVASGTYFGRLDAAGKVLTGRMTLVK